MIKFELETRKGFSGAEPYLKRRLREVVDRNGVFVVPYFVVEAVYDADTRIPYKSVVSLVRIAKKKSVLLGLQGKAIELPQKTQEQRFFWPASIPHLPTR